MLLLDNQVQAYAWGRVDGLAPLVGRPPSGGPEAELWVGAHPLAPSRLAADPTRTLDEVIAADPVGLLGPSVATRTDGRLPFLLKVLAIGSSLSLQAHPSATEAEAGFAREEAAGIPLTADHRTYKDPSPKPEMLVALVDTWALCGFRDPAEALGLIESLGLPALDSLLPILRRGGSEATEGALRWVFGLSASERRAVSAAVSARVGPAPTGEPDGDLHGWVARLAVDHPGDPGCLAPLVLNLVHLAPGQAIHLPAGNLHAYLSGAGVEIMAASDNVLRGGLTQKHIDVPELLRILDMTPGLPPGAHPVEVAPGVRSYDVGEAAFALTRLQPSEAGGSIAVTGDGPGLLLATGGPAKALGPDGAVDLVAGAAVFVAAGDGSVRVEGSGTVWWATAGAALRA